MRVKKIGDWTYNRGARNGEAGIYLEAVDAVDEYRYAAISYGFLHETKETQPLLKGEVVDVALITPDELATRLPSVK